MQNVRIRVIVNNQLGVKIREFTYASPVVPRPPDAIMIGENEVGEVVNLIHTPNDEKCDVHCVARQQGGR